jgi:hypothetical protein
LSWKCKRQDWRAIKGNEAVTLGALSGVLKQFPHIEKECIVPCIMELGLSPVKIKYSEDIEKSELIL